jgi:hypothetical protein
MSLIQRYKDDNLSTPSVKAPWLLGRSGLALILSLDHLLALVEHLLHGCDAVLHHLGRIP